MNNLTSSEFKNIYDNNKNMTDKPILLYFYEKWNPTSKFFEEVINKLEPEYKNKVNFYKIDAGNEYNISSTFNVRGTPFLTFISKEGSIFLNTSITDEDTLKNNIEKMIQSKPVEKVIPKKSEERVIPKKVNKQFIQKKDKKLVTKK